MSASRNTEGLARKAMGTTTEIVGTFIKSSAVVANTILTDKLVQLTSLLDTSTPNAAEAKSAIEERLPFLASTVNTLVIAHDLYTLIARAMVSGVWNELSTGEKISIGVLFTLGAVGTGCSLWQFGAEQQVVAAGLAAAGGSTFFSLATTVLNHAARRRDIHNEYQTINGGYIQQLDRALALS